MYQNQRIAGTPKNPFLEDQARHTNYPQSPQFCKVITPLTSKMESLIRDAFDGEVEAEVEEAIDEAGLDFSSMSNFINSVITLGGQITGLDPEKEVGDPPSNPDYNPAEKYALLIGEGDGINEAVRRSLDEFVLLLRDRDYTVIGDDYLFGLPYYGDYSISSHMKELGSKLDGNDIVVIAFVGLANKAGQFIWDNYGVSWTTIATDLDSYVLDEYGNGYPTYYMESVILDDTDGTLAGGTYL